MIYRNVLFALSIMAVAFFLIFYVSDLLKISNSISRFSNISFTNLFSNSKPASHEIEHGSLRSKKCYNASAIDLAFLSASLTSS